MKNERGAALIMVAVALLGLTLFSAIVVDYGIVWVARGQAQNAADAGALAAMEATLVDPSDEPAARAAGVAFVTANPIWNEATQPPDITVTLPITCPPGTGGGVSCVKVDVFRGTTGHANTLPVFFASLGGITSQAIQATATAQLAGANSADCLRPWFVLDKAGGGYVAPDDIGTEIILDSRVVNSGFGKIDVGTGEAGVVDSVYQCSGFQPTVGQVVPTQTGAAGNPTARAVNDVIDWDIDAFYNPLTKQIEDSCVPSCDCDPYAVCPNGNRMSPRIFVAPLCSPVGDAGCVSGGNGTTHEITITKFLSFFVVSATAHGGDIEIHAILVAGAGELEEGPADPGAFLRTTRLVR